jgi:hypothetical protein
MSWVFRIELHLLPGETAEWLSVNVDIQTGLVLQAFAGSPAHCEVIDTHREKPGLPRLVKITAI